MAKIHDEQRDPEHDGLIADVKKNIHEVAGLVYPEFGAKRHIKIEPKRNNGECDYVIASVSDYAKDTIHQVRGFVTGLNAISFSISKP